MEVFVEFDRLILVVLRVDGDGTIELRALVAEHPGDLERLVEFTADVQLFVFKEGAGPGLACRQVYEIAVVWVSRGHVPHSIKISARRRRPRRVVGPFPRPISIDLLVIEMYQICGPSRWWGPGWCLPEEEKSDGWMTNK